MTPEVRTLGASATRNRRTGGLAGLLAAHYAAWRQRRALAELDDARLDDLGITRGEALREASRWDVPSNWRK